MFDEKPFKALHIGELFTLFGHGLSVKMDKDTALDLGNGQLYPLHFNKKVSSHSSFTFSQKLFLANRQGQPVICQKIHGGFDVSRFLILKTEFVQDAAELQGIPYGADDGVDIILKDIITHIETANILTKALSLRRERSL